MENIIDDELLRDFERYFIVGHIAKFYKGGLFWRERLRWKLTLVWNSTPATAGIPGSVREQLGEEEATRLFQDICDSYLRDRNKIHDAIIEYEEELEAVRNGLV